MPLPLFQIKSYLTYWLNAVDEHSLHSPFFFDFYTRVVKGKTENARHSLFENLRAKLLQNKMTLEVTDLGAGSVKLSGSLRQVRAIAATSLSPARYSSLYHRIIQYFDCKTILELGTSLGVNTLYLADTPGVHVTTFEGASAMADIARSTFEFAEAKNITLKEGDIEHTLPAFLPGLPRFDFALLDANHRYDPTIRYFSWLVERANKTSIVVLDDIHQSKEMHRAWQKLKGHAMVYGSADLYRCGILFFDPSLNKQHVVLQF